MRALLPIAVSASLAAACAAPVVATDSEQDEREQLQAAHDATLQLELRGHLDAKTLARGVREVRAWWTPTSSAVAGAVDEHGVLRVRLPAMAVRTTWCTPVVHVVDGAGAHWYFAPDLATAPPFGVIELGELRLLREPDSPTVVDDRGRALPNARVALEQETPLIDLGTVTDQHGSALLCRAAPFGDRLHLVVRHEDFAPWWGELTSRVQLDHGGEVRGRVVLPPGVDASDFAIHVWIDEAVPQLTSGVRVYADVTAPLLRDGSYRLRNVPTGSRRVGVVDRLSGEWLGGHVDTEVVGPEPTTAPDLEFTPERTPNVAMRIRLFGEDGHPVTGSRATILVSDVGMHATLHNGTLDWIEHPDEPFAIAVPGYLCPDRSTHRTGETIRLRGGHRVALRLALDSARRLPLGCALRAGVSRLEYDEAAFFSDPICYASDPDDRYGTELTIADDADVLVASTGRYAAHLELVRWDAGVRQFASFAIDVEPREFVVPQGAERTFVTLSTQFIQASR